MGQVVTREELASLVAKFKSNEKIIVTTNGCFDILHVGHVRILNEAKALGDVLIVGMNSDDSVRRLKGDARPIVCETDRAEILANLASVDLVTIFDEDTPVEFLRVANPAIHVKGQDYSATALAEAPVVEAMGGSVKLLPLVPSKSTTSLVSKIRSL